MISVFKSKRFWLIAGSILLVAILLAAYLLYPRNSSMSGAISFDDQADLPQGSRLVIQILAAGGSQADGVVLAEQVITDPSRSPVAFELEYEAADDVYLTASILDADGQSIFASGTVYAIGGVQDLTGIRLALKAVEQNDPVAAITERAPLMTDTETDMDMDADAVTESSTDTRGDKSQQVSEAVQATMIVNVHYDRDYNLPADAELSVSLRNMGTLANSLNLTIAQKRLTNPGRPPAVVKLVYDPDEAPAANRYLVSVGIYRQDGKELMTNSTFGFELSVDELDEIDVHLIVIYPDKIKSDEELDAVLTGSIRYSRKCMLPEGAKLVIQLRDVSYADAPSLLIAEKEILDPGDAPVRFELRYDSSDLEERRLYAISGQIYGPGGSLLFVNDTVYEVITRGNPSRIGLPLVRVGASC